MNTEKTMENTQLVQDVVPPQYTVQREARPMYVHLGKISQRPHNRCGCATNFGQPDAGGGFCRGFPLLRVGAHFYVANSHRVKVRHKSAGRIALIHPELSDKL